MSSFLARISMSSFLARISMSSFLPYLLMFITVDWPDSKFDSACVRVSELLSVLSFWKINFEKRIRSVQTGESRYR
jgi:hypothetical protein